MDSSAAFGQSGPLDYAEVELVAADRRLNTGWVRGRTITPDDALLEYLDLHGMRRISRRLLRTGAIDVVATAAPGIKDILVLGKVKQLERAAGGAIGVNDDSPANDLIVLDAPAAGHAVTFLQSAHGLLDAVRVGPIRTQAHEVVNLLTDPDRCQVILVTLPEETPVNELVETAYSLEDRVGVQLGPVIVNGLYPVLEGLDADPIGLAAGRRDRTFRGRGPTTLGQAADFRAQRQQLRPSNWSAWPRPFRSLSCTSPICSPSPIGPDGGRGAGRPRWPTKWGAYPNPAPWRDRVPG